MKEIWKPVNGYENYYMCSNFGRFKKIKRKIYVIDKYWNREYWKTINANILKQFNDTSGYPIVNICGKRKRAHRLIAKTFIPNPFNKPTVNHKDLNKSNNKLDNLEWATYRENSHHAIKNGAYDPKKCGVFSMKNVYMCDLKTHKLLKTFNSTTEAYNYFGKKYQGGISEVCNNKRNKCMGYWWTYDEEQAK
jgi:hypothetical protein